jgi:hypothetical protein
MGNALMISVAVYNTRKLSRKKIFKIKNREKLDEASIPFLSKFEIESPKEKFRRNSL